MFNLMNTVASLTLIGSIGAMSIGSATGLIDAYRPLLNEIANPSEYQITTTCGKNDECKAGLLNDARQLRMALQMYDEATGNLALNQEALDAARQ